MNSNGFRFAFYDHQVDFTSSIGCPHFFEGGVADKDVRAVLFASTLQSSSEVDSVSNDCVVAPFLGTDVS